MTRCGCGCGLGLGLAVHAPVSVATSTMASTWLRLGLGLGLGLGLDACGVVAVGWRRWAEMSRLNGASPPRCEPAFRPLTNTSALAAHALIVSTG